jgi:prepilin-type N-terminal cleavage/methylation domain-containing protein
MADRIPRRGFTLAEVIVSVAVVAILAAITIPTITSRLAVGRGQALAKEIQALATAIQAFHNNAGVYPLYLDQLVSLSAHTTDPCGNTISTTAWKGPYINRLIAGDYVTADGNTVVDLLNRNAAGIPVYLELTVNNVAADVAAVVEEALDGPGGGFTTGSFKWVAGTGVATYRMVVKSTCP